MATFGVLLSNRSFFPDHLVLTARKKLLSALKDWGHEVITLSTDDTFMGETMTYEEARKCAALFRERADELDGIVICLPNFGEETGIADAIKWSKCDVPILIQACDDDFDKLQLENRRDAFCGKLSLCNNLYQYGIKYTLTARHTCPVDGAEFKADVERFAKVCAVVKAMKTARIAQIGARVMPFRTVRYSEKLLQKYGITVETEDFSETNVMKILFTEKATEKEINVQKQLKNTFNKVSKHFKSNSGFKHEIDFDDLEAVIIDTIEKYIST